MRVANDTTSHDSCLFTSFDGAGLLTWALFQPTCHNVSFELSGYRQYGIRNLSNDIPHNRTIKVGNDQPLRLQLVEQVLAQAPTAGAVGAI